MSQELNPQASPVQRLLPIQLAADIEWIDGHPIGGDWPRPYAGLTEQASIQLAAQFTNLSEIFLPVAARGEFGFAVLVSGLAVRRAVLLSSQTAVTSGKRSA